MINRIRRLAPVLAVATWLCATVPLGAHAQPRIEFETEAIDLGRVQGTAPVGSTFRLRNTGDAPLEILDLNAACGCIAAMASQSVLDPGQEGEIAVSLDPTRVGDRRTKVVTVYSTDPVRSVLYLKVTAVVEHAVRLSDSIVSFGTLSLGETRDRTLIVYSGSTAPLTLARVEAASDQLAFTWAPSENGNEQRAYVIGVQLTAGTIPGTFVDTMHIAFEEPEAPMVEVPVRAMVVGPVVANPRVLGLGLARPGEALERGVQVTAPTVRGFRIRRVESTSQHLVPAVVRLARGHYAVTVQVGEDAPKGSLNAMLRIYTTAQDQPLVEVPVTGMIR